MLDLFAFATDRVAGLGMTAREFWGATWAELAARRRAFDLNFHQRFYAGLQATIHNAAWGSKERSFSSEMFMPGYRDPKEAEEVPQWKRERDRVLQTIRGTRARPEPTPENHALVVQLDDRARRARDAKERVESREVIDRIMQGVA